VPYDDDRMKIADNFAPTEIIPGLMAPPTLEIPRVTDDEPVTEFFGPVPRLPEDAHTTAFERLSASETVPDRLKVSKPVKGRHRTSTGTQASRKGKRQVPPSGTWRRAFHDLVRDPDGVFYLLFVIVCGLVVFWWTLVSFKPEWVPPAINPRTTVQSPSPEPSYQPPVRRPKQTQAVDPRPIRTHRQPVVPKPSASPSAPSGTPEPSTSPEPSDTPSGTPTPGPSETPTDPMPSPTPTSTATENDQQLSPSSPSVSSSLEPTP
jgi:hypothetical protein